MHTNPAGRTDPFNCISFCAFNNMISAATIITVTQSDYDRLPSLCTLNGFGYRQYERKKKQQNKSSHKINKNETPKAISHQNN